MNDNLKIKRPLDPTKININQSWELQERSKSWGISQEKIIQAVKKVGPMVLDVKRHLGIK